MLLRCHLISSFSLIWTLKNVLIREEDEDEEDTEPQAKKRKVKVNVSYFVQRQNEDEALEIIRSEKIWANFCLSNETAEGTKSMFLLVFSEKYHCYHIFVVAIYKQLITIPNVFKNPLIGQKP